mgnify:FL=1
MDPISDMFIRIKNAQKAGHESVQIYHSKFKHEILKVLERSGFVGKIERKGKRLRRTLEVALLYKDEAPKVNDVKLISKPSRRLYAPYKELGRPRHGGIIILSTPMGVMTSIDARKAKVGGQLIAEVW